MHRALTEKGVAVDEYDAAIEEASADDATRDMLTDQQTALLAKIAEMKAM